MCLLFDVRCSTFEKFHKDDILWCLMAVRQKEVELVNFKYVSSVVRYVLKDRTLSVI